MLKLYNSLSRQIEEFAPLRDRTVGIYVCGPTVYGPVHLGHARTWIFFDWLRRFLKYKKYKVNFVQNITDVGHLVEDAETGEDKIEKEAKKMGKSPAALASFYEKEYFQDLTLLNILKPDYSPRATDYVKEMISYIKALLEKGFAYEMNGNVYFDISKFPEYGKLSGRRPEDMKGAVRVEEDKSKKNPADFALWLKADKTHLQKWPSPWSEGYPGWHLECSVMSAKILGQPFDIHGSAAELIFPHHENEIAQSKAYADKPLAKYWLHSGMLLTSGEKMSKSKKNYVTVKDALKEADADTIKLAFMGVSWKKPFNWEKKALSEAKKLKERLVRAKATAQPVKTGIPTLVEEALDDDFNVPKALAILMENPSKLSRSDFGVVEGLFGLKLKEGEISQEQEKMIKERETAREKGDYQEADKIREKLKKEGIIIEDTPSGTRVVM